MLGQCRRSVPSVVVPGYLAIDDKFFTGFQQPPDVFDKLVLVAFVKRQSLATYSLYHFGNCDPCAADSDDRVFWIGIANLF